jgi:hypothetical protein
MQLHLHRWRADPTQVTMLSDAMVAAADLEDDGPSPSAAPAADVVAESAM